MGDQRLRIIDGGKADKPKRKRPPSAKTPWQCRTCEADIGVRTSALMKVRQNPFEDGRLKISGGSDAWVCAFCLSRGKLTQVTS